jgi:thioredoxin 1
MSISFPNDDGFVLVDFHALWCEPCKWVIPILDDVLIHFEGKISLEKCDIDEHPDVAKDFHVMSVPTLILFHNKKEIWRMRGFDTAQKMIRVLEDFVK